MCDGMYVHIYAQYSNLIQSGEGEGEGRMEIEGEGGEEGEVEKGGDPPLVGYYM